MKKINRFIGITIAVSMMSAMFSAFSVFAEESTYSDWTQAAMAAQENTDYTVTGDTYYISTAKGLAYAAYIVNNGQSDINITLSSDIHLENSGVTDYPLDREEKKIENGWIPIGKSQDVAYSGIFDGDGHSIYALYVGTEQARGGLIGVLNDGEVKNLKIKSGEVHGTYAAGIAAEVINSNITSCQSSAYIGGTEYAGGIAAKVTGTSDENVVIYDTSTSCYVGSDNYGGGIAGYCEYTSIIDCGSGSIAEKAKVTISKDVYGNTRHSVGVDVLICGGLVGEAAENVNIENCNNANSIYIKNSGTGGGIAGIISAKSGSYINNVACVVASDGGNVTKGALYGEIKNALDLTFDECYYASDPGYTYMNYLNDPCGAGDEELSEDTFTVYYMWGACWVLNYNLSGHDTKNKIITYLNENVNEHNTDSPEYEYTAWQESTYGVGLNKTYTITVHGTRYFIEDAEPTEVVSYTVDYTQNTKGKFEMFINNLMGTYHYTYGFQLNEYVINQGARSKITIYTCAIFTDMDLYYTIYDETSTPSYCQAVAADEEKAAELEGDGINVKDGVYGGEENGTTFATGFHYYALPVSTNKDNNYLRFFVPKGSYYVDENGEIKQTEENKWSQMKYQFDTQATSGSIVFSIVIDNLYAPDARMDIAENKSDDEVYNNTVVNLDDVGDFYEGSN